MSIETERKLLKVIKEYRVKARGYEKGSALQAMHTAYADGIRRAIAEIRKAEREEKENERKIL